MNKTRIIGIGLLLLVAAFATLFGIISQGHAQSIQEWSDPVNLSMSGTATKPSMVVDSQGVLHVIWLDLIDGFKYVQSADGLTWTVPVIVKFPFSVDGPPPVMFSDPNGAIHIFWLSDQNKLVYAQSSSENLDTPSGWRRRIDVDSQVFDFDAGLDPQGGLHVAYVKNPAPTPGAAGVFYRRLSVGTNTFTNPTLIYESAYFRTLTAENAHIRLDVAGEPGMENVHIVWDDRLQKRIFIVTSMDGGSTWGPVREMIAPQANLGFRTPYGADIDILDDKILVTWLVGEPGNRCTPFSWFSSDGGETWGEQVPILSESSPCPEKSEFISIEPGYSVDLFTIQGDLSLSAWNGSVWSSPEVQTGPSTITNPATFDQVLLGCEQAATYNGRLFIVGCDEGTGGDIWFIERQLDPLDSLFPLPSEWSEIANIAVAPRKLESLVSVADTAGNVHAVWVQSPYLPNESFTPRIEYARWNGSQWISPTPIITNLSIKPRNLTLQIDGHQRLLLSWVNPETGELLFTWSNSERANIPLEWAQPAVIASSLKLMNSPDMLVDGSNRIAIAFAVTLNEGRGIYLIQSDDLGETWSTPVRVFDAVAENWEMVDKPKLAVSADGTLHVLFFRYTLPGDPLSAGLYYSASKDGGVTWSPAETVSEQAVEWADVLAHGNTLHRLWQEKNELTLSTSHQVSLDGGLTWEVTVNIPGESSIDTLATASMALAGSPHFFQVIEQEGQILQEWEWNNERWELLETKKVALLDSGPPTMVEAGETLNGRIYVILGFEKPVEEGIESNLLGIHRSLQTTEESELFVPSISTPSTSPSPTPHSGVEPTATPIPPLADVSNPPLVERRNLIGFGLVTLVVVFILVFTLPRRSK